MRVRKRKKKKDKKYKKKSKLELQIEEAMVKNNEEDAYKCKDIDMTDAKNDKAACNVEKKAKTEMK